ADARADDMQGAERNDRPAERELGPFPRREVERAPAQQRPHGQHEMHQQRAVEGDLPRQALPEEDEPDAPGLDDAQRDQAERVIEQMRGDIEEEDVARPEAEPSDHGPISGAAAPLPVAARSPPASLPRRSAA